MKRKEDLATDHWGWHVWFPAFCAVAFTVVTALALRGYGRTALFVLLPSIVFAIASINSVPPAHAALVLRLGRRVVTGYWEDVEDSPQRIVSLDEAETRDDFDPNASTIHREYLTKGEGLRIVLPLIETLRIFSLERREATVDAEDTYVKGTDEQAAVGVIPEMLYVWRISNLGRAIEFAAEAGDVVAAFKKGLEDAIISGARTAFALCDLKQAITKTIKRSAVEHYVALPKDGVDVPIGDVILSDIRDMVARWGITLESVRIRDVQPGKDAEDVFEQWEAVLRAEYKKQEDVKNAQRDLEVRTLQAQAGLVEAQRRADGTRAEIAGLVGKKAEEIGPEDAQAYIAYRGVLGMTDALGKDTKVVLVPPGDLSKLAAGLTSIVTEVTKVTKTSTPGPDSTKGS